MELESPDSLARRSPRDFRKERELGPITPEVSIERGGGVLNIDIFPAIY